MSRKYLQTFRLTNIIRAIPLYLRKFPIANFCSKLKKCLPTSERKIGIKIWRWQFYVHAYLLDQARGRNEKVSNVCSRNFLHTTLCQRYIKRMFFEFYVTRDYPESSVV